MHRLTMRVTCLHLTELHCVSVCVVFGVIAGNFYLRGSKIYYVFSPRLKYVTASIDGGVPTTLERSQGICEILQVTTAVTGAPDP